MKRIILFFLLVSAFSGAVAQDIYNKARVALSSRDTAAAFTGFQEAVKQGQKSAESNYFLGAISFARGNIDAALGYLKASLKADDDYVEALHLIGEVYLAKKEPTSALPHLRFATRLAPSQCPITVSLGNALLEADSIDPAILTLTRARECNPNNPRVYISLGDAYMKQGVVPLGVINYQKALEIDSLDIASRMKLALAFSKNRQYNDMIRELRVIQAIDPANPDPFYEEGRILVAARLYPQAIPSLKQLTELRPNFLEGGVLYIKALFGADRYGDVIEVAPTILKRDSSDVDVWRAYAYSLVDAKESEGRDYKIALSAFKAIERRKGTKIDDQVKLGKVYYSLGMESEAFKAYNEALANDSSACDPYFDLGSIYMKKQDYVKASAMFEKKIACDPRNLSAYVNAGICYMQPSASNLPRARELFLGAIDKWSEFLQARLWLARYYSQADSLELAKSQYEEVLKQIGDRTDKYKREAGEAHNLTGGYYFIRKQYDRAIDSYSRALSVGYDNAAQQLSWGQALILSRGDDPAENRKKIEDAVKRFRRSIDLDPNNAQSHLWLAQSLVFSRVEGDNELNRKLNEEACSEYRKVLKLDPRNDDAQKGMERIGCK